MMTATHAIPPRALLSGGLAPTLLLSLALPAVAQVAPLPPGDIPFGVYDPPGNFAETEGVTIEHLFLPWEDVALESLFDAADYAAARGRVLLVTLEPWTWVRSSRNAPHVLRDGIASGSYDSNVLGVCRILGQLDVPVTFRWGHEMDHYRGDFIWAGWAAADYIAAFQHVTSLCRSVAPEITVMWSPLGDDGMEAYWPGGEHVDLIGLTVFGLQRADRMWHGRDRSFTEILAPRYERAVQFDRPIVVAELGYSGTRDYVEAWENEIRQVGETFPDLVGVVYFNFPEVYPWPEGLGLPDWRVFERIIE